MKITKLTPEQIARFPEFVEKWKAIGLSTEPADRVRAENGIRKTYEIAGLQHPKSIVWCGSPLSQGLTRAIIMGLGNVKTGRTREPHIRRRHDHRLCVPAFPGC